MEVLPLGLAAYLAGQQEQGGGQEEVQELQGEVQGKVQELQWEDLDFVPVGRRFSPSLGLIH